MIIVSNNNEYLDDPSSRIIWERYITMHHNCIVLSITSNVISLPEKLQKFKYFTLDNNIDYIASYVKKTFDNNFFDYKKYY